MFNIDEIFEHAKNLSFEVTLKLPSRVDVNLGDGFILIFENLPDDTIIRFDNGWHSHGDILAVTLGIQIEDVPVIILNAIKAGQALLVRESFPNRIQYISLEFKSHISPSYIPSLEPGESIEFRRAA